MCLVRGERMEKQWETYLGNDLGVTYTSEKAIFRLWAPTAENVKLCLYKEGDGDCLITTADMTKSKGGTWMLERRADFAGIYYTYLVTIDGVSYFCDRLSTLITGTTAVEHGSLDRQCKRV